MKVLIADDHALVLETLAAFIANQEGMEVRSASDVAGTLKLIGSEGRCCTNRARDSLHESSMIAGKHEQLGPYEVQDHELVGLQ